MDWKIENQLCFLMYASSRQIIKAYKPFLDPYHLTYTQYITMIALWQKDEQLVSELGEKLALDSGTLTPLLKKLEKDGKLNRIRDRQDERKVIVKLTQEGRLLGDKMKHVPYDTFNCVNLSKEEAMQLFQLLNKFYQQKQPCIGDEHHE